MSSNANRHARWKELWRLDDRNLPAATVIRAQQLCADYPESGPAWLLLGNALTGLAKYKAAELAIKRGIKLLPTAHHHIGFTKLGDLFREAGDYRLAAAWFRRAIKAAPQITHNYIFLGAVLAKSGRLRDAEKIHRQAVATREGCIDEAHLNLGLVLRAQSRFVEALACFQEALRICPGYREAKEAIKDVQKCLAFTKERNGQ